ncbi:M10 family metallopeptidase, partial [Rhizobium ruizarguesonis]
MTNLITSIEVVSMTGDEKIDGIFDYFAWDGTITSAFPTTSGSYAYSGEKDYGFSSISSQQQSFALFFMEQSYGNAANDGFSVEGFTNANFEAGSANTATVRFAQSSQPPTAWAYTPNAGGPGGDVWFGTAYAGTENDLRFPEFGNYAGHTLAHELGHALGLKHAHDRGEFNWTLVPTAYDSLEYTVMTYHTYVGDDLSGLKYEHDGAPQTFMMLDIAALQEMYGADYTTNSGDTVYKWNPNQGITYVNGVAAITPAANRIFATIWDGGGIDTYDLSAYTTALRIDLRAGGYSVFSQGQLADLGGGPNNGYARGNIFNALLYHNDVASLIENVNGGSGDDTIIGNEANNTLWGNAGNDTLSGGSGTDTLIGGAGNDTYTVDDLTDVVTEGLNAGTDLIQTALSSYALTSIANVENLTFIGTGNFVGTGSSLSNTITGGAGNDTLDGGADNDRLWGGAGNDLLNGGAGNDTMTGGAGNDIFVVDDGFDFAWENANQGTDTVRTALSSYWLSDNVEILTYTGSASFTGIGNGLANTITGGAGNDTLNGG